MRRLLAFVLVSLFIGYSAFTGESEKAKEKDNDNDSTKKSKVLGDDSISDNLLYKLNLLYGKWERKDENGWVYETHTFTKGKTHCTGTYRITHLTNLDTVYEYQIKPRAHRGDNDNYIVFLLKKGNVEKEMGMCFGDTNAKPWDENTLNRPSDNGKITISLHRVIGKEIKKPEKPEKPDKVEKLEKIEKPDKVEKPEKKEKE